MHRITVAVSILGDYNANAVSLRRRRSLERQASNREK
jgi:hypothetical protein